MSWEKCIGKPCSSVWYKFLGADMDNLTYVYRDQQGRESTGTLGPRNARHKARWAMALTWRLWFPPFNGISPKCGDGCSCQLGQPTTTTQQHTFTATFQFSHNRSITITGTFSVEVTTRVGVCVTAPQSVFSPISQVDESAEYFAAIVNKDDDMIDPDPETGANKC